MINLQKVIIIINIKVDYYNGSRLSLVLNGEFA